MIMGFWVVGARVVFALPLELASQLDFSRVAIQRRVGVLEGAEADAAGDSSCAGVAAVGGASVLSKAMSGKSLGAIEAIRGRYTTFPSK